MKWIILPSTILAFSWLVIGGFMEENGIAPSTKKDIRSSQFRRSPRNLKSSQPLATRREKKLAPHPQQKKGSGYRGVYTMENKDTNTDYQKFVRAGDEKWEIAEITIGIIFFFFAWDSYWLFFYRCKLCPPSSIHLHPVLCNTLNIIRTKILHVIGQFPQTKAENFKVFRFD